MTAKLYLRPGKDKPLLNHHPWIFSGALARVEPADAAGIVEVYGAQGNWLARAAYNPHSQIAARVWTFDRDEEIDRAFFKRRLQRAWEWRTRLGLTGERANAYRLVNAESDGLPGLVVDRYADFLVVQFLTRGAESFKSELTGALMELVSPRGIYERSEADVRQKEKLPRVTGVLCGDAPPDRLELVEHALHFWVEVKTGHKTGFYLDQRANRPRVAAYLRGEVLNVFAYTGAFGVYAARAGATHVLNLDASAAALDLARENYALNGLTAGADFTVADAFESLRVLREAGRQFDAIILDPPKFVHSAGQMERALRGYQDLNRLAFQLLRADGILVTFSCSGLVSPELFQKVVFGALVDARRNGQLVEKLSQSPDHPIALTFPEAEYLKGLVVRVV